MLCFSKDLISDLTSLICIFLGKLNKFSMCSEYKFEVEVQIDTYIYFRRFGAYEIHRLLYEMSVTKKGLQLYMRHRM